MAGKVPGRLGELLGECGRLLQVALDYTSPWDALRTGIRALSGRAVVLEAGTPLIKSYGMDAVRMLRSLPGASAVVADTKTMDTGRLELELAASAGADAVTVLGAAPEETIREMVGAAEERGVAVMADLIGIDDPVGAAGRLRGLGAHIVLLHIGIDVQRKLGITAAQRAELVSRIKEAFGGPVAVAGGIKPGEAGALARAGADIIIIGGAITRSPDPRAASLEALKSLSPRCL